VDHQRRAIGISGYLEARYRFWPLLQRAGGAAARACMRDWVRGEDEVVLGWMGNWRDHSAEWCAVHDCGRAEPKDAGGWRRQQSQSADLYPVQHDERSNGYEVPGRNLVQLHGQLSTSGAESASDVGCCAQVQADGSQRDLRSEPDDATASVQHLVAGAAGAAVACGRADARHRGDWADEHHAGGGAAANPRDWGREGAGRAEAAHSDAVSSRGDGDYGRWRDQRDWAGVSDLGASRENPVLW